MLYEAPQAEERAVSAETACLVTDMLRTAAAEGSANALSAVGTNVAGKTGTVDMESGGNRDIWTVAYTPKLAVAVWMGFDEPDAEHALPDWAGGSSYPARLCANFLTAVGDVGRAAALPRLRRCAAWSSTRWRLKRTRP